MPSRTIAKYIRRRRNRINVLGVGEADHDEINKSFGRSGTPGVRLHGYKRVRAGGICGAISHRGPESSYVVRQTVVAPPPIVRKRTVVVTRPAYVPATVLRLPHYGYAEERYVVTDW
jgi:hypothetical protein